MKVMWGHEETAVQGDQMSSWKRPVERYQRDVPRGLCQDAGELQETMAKASLASPGAGTGTWSPCPSWPQSCWAAAPSAWGRGHLSWGSTAASPRALTHS